MKSAIPIFLLILLVALPVAAHAQFSLPLVNCKFDPCQLSDLVPLLDNFKNFLIWGVMIPVATIAIVYAGIKYILAGGNAGEIEQAHKIFLGAFIGILVSLAAWLIIKAILDQIASSGYQLHS